MTNRGRMKKLYPGLTALERALLVLKAWKQSIDEDPQLRHAMPAYQVREFNRYVDLMNGANTYLGPFIILVKALTEQTSIRFGWLCTIRLWTADSLSIAHAAFMAAREPINESDYKARLDEARNESVPIEEFAQYLAEREITADATDRQWQQAVANKAAMIEEAVNSGAVAAHTRSRRILVLAGSFYEWLGEPLPVYPDWGFAYDVRLDGEDITPLKKRFDGLREALLRSHAGIGLPPEFRAKKLEGMARFGDEATRLLEESIRDGFAARWCELSAIETVVAEVQEEFAGEDPLLPELRSSLDAIKATLEELRERIATFGIEVDPPGQDPELDQHVRRLVHRDVNDHTIG